MELVVEDLACRRAGRRVFAGVSFRLAAGGLALLLGPNGAGKSSLLRTLAGLTPAEAGTARLADGSAGVALADREAFQERVAYAGHLDAVKPQLTVAANLAFWAEAVAAPAARVGAALERFGLAGVAAQPALYCSAGQRRRLGLARLALAERPLWLLDEPTVSLDAASAEALAGMLRAHLEAGGLAVVATHAPLGLPAAAELRLEGPGAAAARAPASAPGGEDLFLDGAW